MSLTHKAKIAIPVNGQLQIILIIHTKSKVVTMKISIKTKIKGNRKTIY